MNARQSRSADLGGARSPAGGFTLIEILLVLALLALFSALFIPGVNSILRQINERGPEQALAETILAARGAALESGRTVTLTYDEKRRALHADDASVADLVLEPDHKLALLPPTSGAVVLLGGQSVETDELRRIRFFSDGTCDPFRVRLQENKDAARIWTADPWTCALSPEKAER